jgi:tetratricopeptide (TPR) repeat protein
MKERDIFLKVKPDSPSAATFEYQSARNYYRYGHWDEAKVRYEDLYKRYCQKDEIAMFSWKTLLNMATDQNDLDAKEKWALLEQKRKCGEGLGAGKGEEGIDLGSLLGDVAMQRAMGKFKECMDSKDAKICTDAGSQLVAAVAKAPKHQSADAALHNAALAYETAKRFETAMQLYGRIVNEYPKSRWVDKCLFKQAYSANAFFEYEKALSSYKILADEPRFKDSEYRNDAIINTALILTNLQSYKEAIPYWEKYSRNVDDQAKSIEAAFNAADMYFRAKSYRNAVSAYDAFIAKYKRNPEAGPYVVKASYRIGLANGYRHKNRLKVAAWENTVGYYNSLVKEPGSISAEYAAESHFMLIERDMRKFEKFSISGSQKQIDKKMKKGAETVKKFEERYREVQKYRRPVWSLAAEFRIGYAYEVYAKAILKIPPPPLDKKLQKALKKLPPEDREAVMMQYEDKFQEAMEKHVSAMEERAQAEYKIAVNLAREGNISNEWTLLALERMNAYDPDGYPRQHNGIVLTEDYKMSVPLWAPMESK